MDARIWQLDFFRGLAVIAMVAFNWSYALTYLGILDWDFSSPNLHWAGRIIAFSFVFIAGSAMYFSHKRASKKLEDKQLQEKHMRRGAFLLLLGLGISAATWLFDPSATIWFGILHLIGISVILATPLLLWKMGGKKIVALAAAIISLGYILGQIRTQIPYLLPLGIWPSGWFTFDYEPIIPWFGYFLLGIAAGKYAEKWLRENRSDWLGKIRRPISFLGRHTLAIYLIHQPILIFSLILQGYLPWDKLFAIL